MPLTVEELAKLLPLFEGPFHEVRDRLAPYNINRVALGSIRQLLGFSDDAYPHKRKLTPEQIRELVEKYKEGDTSIRKLSIEYGIETTAVYGLLRRRHIDTTPKDLWSPIKKRRFIEMRKQGRSYFEIGKMFGISYSAASQMGRRLGFPVSKDSKTPFVQIFDPFEREREKEQAKLERQRLKKHKCVFDNMEAERI